MNTTETGKKGEAIAESFLMGKGYLPVCRNFRFQSAEIDLIMRDGDTVVYVEVKLRRGDELPRLAVTARKRALICRAAAGFAKQRGLLRAKSRFDVVEVCLRGGIAECAHLPNAFPFSSDRYYL